VPRRDSGVTAAVVASGVLINATGMSGEQILGALRRRTAHDDAAETAEIKVELTKLVQLRLTKLTAELGAGASAGDLLAGL
jgi:hypothetical protein